MEEIEVVTKHYTKCKLCNKIKSITVDVKIGKKAITLCNAHARELKAALVDNLG